MRCGLIPAVTALGLILLMLVSPSSRPSAATSVTAAERADDRAVDVELAKVLEEAGFTGTIESTLERRLRRSINPTLADLGRLLRFDPVHSLHHDNTCGGCHSPTNGFGDSQGMAIGVQPMLCMITAIRKSRSAGFPTILRPPSARSSPQGSPKPWQSGWLSANNIFGDRSWVLAKKPTVWQCTRRGTVSVKGL